MQFCQKSKRLSCFTSANRECSFPSLFLNSLRGTCGGRSRRCPYRTPGPKSISPQLTDLNSRSVRPRSPPPSPVSDSPPPVRPFARISGRTSAHGSESATPSASRSSAQSSSSSFRGSAVLGQRRDTLEEHLMFGFGPAAIGSILLFLFHRRVLKLNKIDYILAEKRG